jgi:hypothetical protein
MKYQVPGTSNIPSMVPYKVSVACVAYFCIIMKYSFIVLLMRKDLIKYDYSIVCMYYNIICI